MAPGKRGSANRQASGNGRKRNSTAANPAKRPRAIASSSDEEETQTQDAPQTQKKVKMSSRFEGLTENEARDWVALQEKVKRASNDKQKKQDGGTVSLLLSSCCYTNDAKDIQKKVRDSAAQELDDDEVQMTQKYKPLPKKPDLPENPDESEEDMIQAEQDPLNDVAGESNGEGAGGGLTEEGDPPGQSDEEVLPGYLQDNGVRSHGL